MADTPPKLDARHGLSKHRLEGLTDGIFAVAMTLLVIELKVPEKAHVTDAAELAQGVAQLIPVFISWIISFFVLGIFWYSHQRLFQHVRVVSAALVWLNIVYLALVSLMPFSSALTGRHGRYLLSQMLYSTNMLLLGLVGLLLYRHVFRHMELQGEPLTSDFYRAARFRTLGVMTVAVLAVGVATLLPGVPGAGNSAFMLMIPVSILSRRREHRASA